MSLSADSNPFRTFEYEDEIEDEGEGEKILAGAVNRRRPLRRVRRYQGLQSRFLGRRVNQEAPE
jgi:hypothetical protein